MNAPIPSRRCDKVRKNSAKEASARRSRHLEGRMESTSKKQKASQVR